MRVIEGNVERESKRREEKKKQVYPARARENMSGNRCVLKTTQSDQFEFDR